MLTGAEASNMWPFVFFLLLSLGLIFQYSIQTHYVKLLELPCAHQNPGDPHPLPVLVCEIGAGRFLARYWLNWFTWRAVGIRDPLRLGGSERLLKANSRAMEPLGFEVRRSQGNSRPDAASLE